MTITKYNFKRKEKNKTKNHKSIHDVNSRHKGKKALDLNMSGLLTNKSNS